MSRNKRRTQHGDRWDRSAVERAIKDTEGRKALHFLKDKLRKEELDIESEEDLNELIDKLNLPV